MLATDMPIHIVLPRQGLGTRLDGTAEPWRRGITELLDEMYRRLLMSFLVLSQVFAVFDRSVAQITCPGLVTFAVFASKGQAV